MKQYNEPISSLSNRSKKSKADVSQRPSCSLQSFWKISNLDNTMEKTRPISLLTRGERASVAWEIRCPSHLGAGLDLLRDSVSHLRNYTKVALVYRHTTRISWCNHNSLSSGSKAKIQIPDASFRLWVIVLWRKSPFRHRMRMVVVFGYWNGMTGSVPIHSYCLHPFRSRHQVK